MPAARTLTQDRDDGLLRGNLAFLEFAARASSTAYSRPKGNTRQIRTTKTRFLKTTEPGLIATDHRNRLMGKRGWGCPFLTERSARPVGLRSIGMRQPFGTQRGVIAKITLAASAPLFGPFHDRGIRTELGQFMIFVSNARAVAVMCHPICKTNRTVVNTIKV